ncbi:MAG: phosphoenolpyruvate carboxylase [Candidatus Kariarchaeaceae archaeon]
MHEDTTSLDPHLLLSPVIKLLGDLLGEVIIEQAGEDCFNLEEQIRKLAKQFRENDDLNALEKLNQEIRELSPEQRITIISSFSLFFQLVNLAEEDFAIKINRIQELADQDHRTDTIHYAIRYAKENNVDYQGLMKLLGEIHVQLVWTAHPTEARRLTNLMKLREIYTLLKKLEMEKANSIKWFYIRNNIKEHITLLWQSDDLRENSVEILDEVRTNLFYFQNTVFDVIPELLKNLSLTIEHEYQIANLPVIPNFLEFGSWVGGDRDGHIFVTSSITIQTLLIQKRLCLRRYLKGINILLREISSSTNLVGISDTLKQSIDKDIELFPDFARKTQRLNRLEPYRRKLDFIRVKLQNTLDQVENSAVKAGLGRTLVGTHEEKYTGKEKLNYYQRSSDFLEELMLINQSLRENRGKIVAEGKLSKMIIQVKVFGFHLAPLDLRQDSEIHLATLDDIYNKIEQIPLSSVSLEKRRELLLQELTNPRPLGVISIRDKLSEMSNEVISTLEVAKQSLEIISPRSIGTYIISMSRDESDVYTLMLLMNEVRIIEISENQVKKAALDIAPLFETKEDLENAPSIMERLFANPLYKSLLQLRNNVQEIMIGYSDSTKDSGVLSSNYSLFIAQQKLVEVAKMNNIHLRIFHGRGGSISRGGGPTNKSILSQPLGTLSRMKITEQGEVIGSTYSNPNITYRHLEQITSAMIIRCIRDAKLEPEKNPANPSAEYVNHFQQLAKTSRKTYEQLVKENSNFIPFYLEFTPLDLIERATIGSRPSRRRSQGVQDISGLRAIPWIFSWMQTRLLLPGFYGVGSALKKFEQENGVEKLREIYSSWPYFESLLNNLQMVELKADLNIADQYRSLVNDEDIRDALFNQITGEYNLAKEMILKVVNSSELLEESPNVQTSIKRRNPYIDPLNLLQVELLKIWRSSGRPEDLSPTGLQRALLQTLNGIAAGLRNTG